MTTYIGRRGHMGAVVDWQTEGGTLGGLPSRLDLARHSPTGFEWGYGGSGPAQLALALLADATGDEAWSLAHYQNFKWKIVADLPREWQMSQREVLNWVEWAKKQDEREAPAPTLPGLNIHREH